MTIFDKSYFTIDTLDVDGTLVDHNGDEIDSADSFDWNEQTTVTVNNQPWIDRFGTDRFHKLEYNLAKPTPQPYTINDTQYHFAKPRDALKKAQWGLDNLAWTMEHPKERRVVRDSQVRAFWKGPKYDETDDLQKAYLYLPANDDEAKQYIEDNNGVSVGFKQQLVRVDDYDGEVGGDFDVDEVDGFQTELYYDHAASVEKARFPSSKGGGLVVDSAMTVDSESTDTTSDEDEGDSSENVDDEDSTDNTKVSTVNTKQSTTMTDEDDDLFGVDTMNVDAIIEQNDGVAELKEQKEQHEDTVDSLESAVDDLDDDVTVDSIVDDYEELKEQKATVKDALDDAKSTLSDYRNGERKELVGELTDMTDRWSEEELMGEAEEEEPTTIDTLKDRIELVSDLTDAEPTTIDSGEGGEEEATDEVTADVPTNGVADLSQTA